MTYQDIAQEIINTGQNPDDFNITVTEGGYSVTPKCYAETKWIAKKEDKPIIEDVNTVAEFATINALDKEELAEMLVYALQRIDELEGKLNG